MRVVKIGRVGQKDTELVHIHRTEVLIEKHFWRIKDGARVEEAECVREGDADGRMLPEIYFLRRIYKQCSKAIVRISHIT